MKLHNQIFLAIIAGAVTGWAAEATGQLWVVNNVLVIVADLFLRLLKMIVIPLVVASVVTGAISVGMERGAGRMLGQTLGYYIVSSLLAILTGLFLVNLLQPGVGANVPLTAAPTGLAAADQSVADLVTRMIPTNPVSALANGEMLPIIFFSLIIGIFIARTDDPHRSRLVELAEAGYQVMLKLTHFVIAFTPIGVFALLAKVIAQTGFDVFVPLGWYALTVALALAAHAIITLPLLLKFVAGIDPRQYARALATPLLTAFSTASSAATLPLTIDAIQTRTTVPDRVSGFVLPLGATVNMDGTALYECVAALFIAQVYGIELSFAQQMMVVATALLASIGAAGIPMAGLVMMSIILNAVGLPLEGIGLILAVDRILDMMRTTVNVWSDSVGAAVVAGLEGHEIVADTGESQ